MKTSFYTLDYMIELNVSAFPYSLLNISRLLNRYKYYFATILSVNSIITQINLLHIIAQMRKKLFHASVKLRLYSLFHLIVIQAKGASFYL